MHLKAFFPEFEYEREKGKEGWMSSIFPIINQQGKSIFPKFNNKKKVRAAEKSDKRNCM